MTEESLSPFPFRRLWILSILCILLCIGLPVPSFGQNTGWDLDLREGTSLINQRATDGNPWNTTIGFIEIDGRDALFMYPGTAAVFTAEIPLPSMKDMTFQYGLHPHAAGISDGTGVCIDVTDYQTGELICSEKEFVNPEGAAQELTIKLNQCAGKKVVFRISCEYFSDEDRDICDWLVVWGVSRTPGYKKAVHYFGNEWPVNFWNSETETLEADLDRIISDGFNYIILVLPWNEFQPSVNPSTWSEYAFDKLNKILETADRKGVGVCLRLGYSWDYYGDSPTYNSSFRHLKLVEDRVYREAWLEYATMINICVRTHPCFAGAFITWEDFWGYISYCDIDDAQERIVHARESGYQSFLANRYTLEHLNAAYGHEYQSYDEIGLPERTDPMMAVFYEFYDSFLVQLLSDTQTVFYGLSMEVRSDWDAIVLPSGEDAYYQHDSTFSCEGADEIALMYGIYQGCENDGEKLSAEEAIVYTERTLRQFQENTPGKDIFVEQFNFYDNTPDFRDNAQVRTEEISAYLKLAVPVLSEYTRGYGIWCYKDYCGNMIFNPQFALGTEGWMAELSDEDADLQELLFGTVLLPRNDSGVNDGCRLKLQPGITLGQEIPSSRDHFSSNCYCFSIDIEPETSGILKVSVGDSKAEIAVTEAGTYELVFEQYGDLHLSFSGSAYIDNVKLFSHVQTELLYGVDWTRGAGVQGMQELNKNL